MKHTLPAALAALALAAAPPLAQAATWHFAPISTRWGSVAGILKVTIPGQPLRQCTTKWSFKTTSTGLIVVSAIDSSGCAITWTAGAKARAKYQDFGAFSALNGLTDTGVACGGLVTVSVAGGTFIYDGSNPTTGCGVEGTLYPVPTVTTAH